MNDTYLLKEVLQIQTKLLSQEKTVKQRKKINI